MTIGELKEHYDEKYSIIKYYMYKDRSHRLLPGYVELISREDIDKYIHDEINVDDYFLMDSEEYQSTFSVNTANIVSDDVVLVIVLNQYWKEEFNKSKKPRNEHFTHQRYLFKLNKQKDSDIIAWLNKQPDMQEAIKKALRDAIE